MRGFRRARGETGKEERVWLGYEGGAEENIEGVEIVIKG